jgi:ATP-dependent DNA helicase RecG
VEETLPDSLLAVLKLPSRKETISSIHFPSDNQSLKVSVARLKFEELFYLQLNLFRQKLLRMEKSKGHVFIKIGDLFNGFYHKRLSFTLTAAQKRVLKEFVPTHLPVSR